MLPFHIGFFHLVIGTYSSSMSFDNRHLVSSMSFHSLIAHFFLALNNIPLSGCTTVCSSIHLLKDVLVSKFWQLWISCYRHLCACFCVIMHLIDLGKYEGVQLLEHMVKVWLVWVRSCQIVCHFAFPPAVKFPVVAYLDSIWSCQYSRFWPFY